MRASQIECMPAAQHTQIHNYRAATMYTNLQWNLFSLKSYVGVARWACWPSIITIWSNAVHQRDKPERVLDSMIEKSSFKYISSFKRNEFNKKINGYSVFTFKKISLRSHFIESRRTAYSETLSSVFSLLHIHLIE